MEDTLLFLMQSAGVDTRGALARFAGNAELYMKFLKRFPQDKAFQNISDALEKEDWPEMLKAAHTLKGVSSNLGMVRLFRACSETVRLLREEKTDEAKESYAEIKAAYHEIDFVLRP